MYSRKMEKKKYFAMPKHINGGWIPKASRSQVSSAREMRGACTSRKRLFDNG